MLFPPITKPLVIIPTYDEAENIERLLREVRQAAPQVTVLVVDDSSPDGTAQIARKVGSEIGDTELLVRRGKEGLGRAYLAAFEWALGRGFDAVVQMDADFSHRPQDLPRLLKELQTCDVAIGCRYMPGGATPGWSLSRRLISRAGNTYARAMLSLHYRDLTGGFNAWRARVLQTIQLQDVKSKGYAYQIELKYRAHCQGYRLSELPIVFDERTHGASKMSANIVREAALRVPRLRSLRLERLVTK